MTRAEVVIRGLEERVARRGGDARVEEGGEGEMLGHGADYAEGEGVLVLGADLRGGKEGRGRLGWGGVDGWGGEGLRGWGMGR